MALFRLPCQMPMHACRAAQFNVLVVVLCLVGRARGQDTLAERLPRVLNRTSQFFGDPTLENDNYPVEPDWGNGKVGCIQGTPKDKSRPEATAVTDVPSLICSFPDVKALGQWGSTSIADSDTIKYNIVLLTAYQNPPSSDVHRYDDILNQGLDVVTEKYSADGDDYFFIEINATIFHNWGPAVPSTIGNFTGFRLGEFYRLFLEIYKTDSSGTESLINVGPDELSTFVGPMAAATEPLNVEQCGPFSNAAPCDEFGHAVDHFRIHWDSPTSRGYGNIIPPNAEQIQYYEVQVSPDNFTTYTTSFCLNGQSQRGSETPFKGLRSVYTVWWKLQEIYSSIELHADVMCYFDQRVIRATGRITGPENKLRIAAGTIVGTGSFSDPIVVAGACPAETGNWVAGREFCKQDSALTTQASCEAVDGNTWVVHPADVGTCLLAPEAPTPVECDPLKTDAECSGIAHEDGFFRIQWNLPTVAEGWSNEPADVRPSADSNIQSYEIQVSSHSDNDIAKLFDPAQGCVVTTLTCDASEPNCDMAARVAKIGGRVNGQAHWARVRASNGAGQGAVDDTKTIQLTEACGANEAWFGGRQFCAARWDLVCDGFLWRSTTSDMSDVFILNKYREQVQGETLDYCKSLCVEGCNYVMYVVLDGTATCQFFTGDVSVTGVTATYDDATQPELTAGTCATLVVGGRTEPWKTYKKIQAASALVDQASCSAAAGHTWVTYPADVGSCFGGPTVPSPFQCDPLDSSGVCSELTHQDGSFRLHWSLPTPSTTGWSNDPEKVLNPDSTFGGTLHYEIEITRHTEDAYSFHLSSPLSVLSFTCNSAQSNCDVLKRVALVGGRVNGMAHWARIRAVIGTGTTSSYNDARAKLQLTQACASAERWVGGRAFCENYATQYYTQAACTSAAHTWVQYPADVGTCEELPTEVDVTSCEPTITDGECSHYTHTAGTFRLFWTEPTITSGWHNEPPPRQSSLDKIKYYVVQTSNDQNFLVAENTTSLICARDTVSTKCKFSDRVAQIGGRKNGEDNYARVYAVTEYGVGLSTFTAFPSVKMTVKLQVSKQQWDDNNLELEFKKSIAAMLTLELSKPVHKEQVVVLSVKEIAVGSVRRLFSSSSSELDVEYHVTELATDNTATQAEIKTVLEQKTKIEAAMTASSAPELQASSPTIKTAPIEAATEQVTPLPEAESKIVTGCAEGYAWVADAGTPDEGVCMQVDFEYENECVVCPQGSFCFQDANNACPTHSKTAAPGDPHVGATSDDINDCVCDGGYFRVPAFDASNPDLVFTCEDCAEGAYCSQGANNACPLHANSPTFSDARTDCTCNQGFTGSVGAAVPPAGSDAECQGCAAGKYKDAAGSASCTGCPADSFSSAVEAVSADTCENCPTKRTTGSTFGTASSDCVCSAGHTPAVPPDGWAYVCNGNIQVNTGEWTPLYSVTTLDGCKTGCQGDCRQIYFREYYTPNCYIYNAHIKIRGYSSTSIHHCRGAVSGYGNALDGVLYERQACEPCGFGEFKSSEDDTDCTSCKTEAGSSNTDTWYTPDIGSTAASACTACPAHSAIQDASGIGRRQDCLCNAGYHGDPFSAEGCQVCAAGKFKNSAGSAACTNCGSNEYSSEGSSACTACHGNSQTLPVTGSHYNVEVHDCLCNAGYTKEVDSTGAEPVVSCTACAAGKFKDVVDVKGSEAACSDCARGSYQNSVGKSSCTPCSDQYETTANEASTAESACVCDKGYYPQDQSGVTSCQLCAAGSVKSAIGDGECTDCSQHPYGEDYYANKADPDAANHACTSCTLTLGETVQDYGIVVTPASDTIADCVCPQGQQTVGGASGHCESCPTGKFKNTDEDNPCSECASGKYFDSTGAISCKDCKGNSQTAGLGSSSTDQCLCNPGYKHVGAVGDGEPTCAECTAGKYKDTAANSGCTLCAAGTFMASNGATKCDTCGVNDWSHEGAIACSDCTSGSSAPAGSTDWSECTCDAGYAYSSDGSSMTCTECELGYYKDSGNRDCTKCPAGQTTSSTGSQSIDACTNCAAGKYESGGVCLDCDTKAESAAGATACQCKAGYAESSAGEACKCETPYAASVAADGSSCTGCVERHYKENAGPQACTECPSGFEDGSAPGVVHDSQSVVCSACVAGKYKDSSGCIDCPGSPNSDSLAQSESVLACSCNPGYSSSFNEHNELTGCTACEEGKYEDTLSSSPTENTCVSCPRGKYSTDVAQASSDTCQTCPAHSEQLQGVSTRNSEDQCICKPGYGKISETGACRKCTAGSYKPEHQNVACTQCSPGKYHDPADDSAAYLFTKAIECVTCPDHSISDAGSTQVAHCVCNAGFLRDTSTSPPTCTQCNANEYCEDENTQALCPDHSNSPAGSSSQASCSCNAGYEGDATRTDIVSGHCNLCQAGFYSAGGNGVTCLRCPDKSTTASSKSSDISECVCENGYYVDPDDATHACQVCPVGSYCAEDARNTCPINSQADANSESKDDCKCNAGFQHIVGHDKLDPPKPYCDVCPRGVLCEGGDKDPFSCPTNAFSVDNEHCRCSDGYYCSEGLFDDDVGDPDNALSCTGTCATCPERHYCALNAKHECPEHSVVATPLPSQISHCICKPGYYRAGNTCVECPAGFYCHNQEKVACSTVDPYSFSAPLSSSPDDCVCSAGMFRFDATDSCKPCMPDFYCPTPDELYKCPPNEYNDYQFMEERTDCVCAAGFKMSSDSDIFTKCLPCQGSERCEAGDESSEDCSLFGKVPNDEHTACVCAPGHYLLVSQTGERCVLCGSGYVKPDKGDHQCQPCPAGEKSISATACEVCQDGATSQEGSDHCTCESPYAGSYTCALCTAGTYRSDEGTCLPCPGESNSVDGAVGVGDCFCNTGAAPNAQGVCAFCPVNTYATPSGCISCGTGSQSPEKSSTPDDCSCDSSNCLVSAWGTPAEAGCIGVCPVLPDACTECAQGRFKGTVGNTLCLQCGQGKYQDQTGTSACEDCPTDEIHTGLGKTRVSDCECTRGHFRDTTSQMCTDCEVGKFKGFIGDHVCDKCAQGKFQNETGKSECVDCTGHPDATVGATTTVDEESVDVADCTCVKGKFKLVDASNPIGECTECALGRYKPVVGDQACFFCGKQETGQDSTVLHDYGAPPGSDSQTDCQDCPANSGQLQTDIGEPPLLVMADQADCVCFPGYEPDGRNPQDPCKQCPNYHLRLTYSDNPCHVCADGHYFEGHAVACTECQLPNTDSSDHSLPSKGIVINRDPASDEYLPWGRSEADCNCKEGYYRVADTCSKCEVGTFRSDLKTTACAVCPKDTYQNNPGEDFCHQCPTGSYTDEATQQTTVNGCKCEEGHQLDGPGAQCSKCVEGKFNDKNGALNGNACSNCAQGTYQDSKGKTACIDCGDFETTPNTGANHKRHCICIPGYGGDATHENCVACTPGKYSLSSIVSDVLAERRPACTDCPAGKTSPGTVDLDPTDADDAVTPSDGADHCVCLPGHGVAADALSDADCLQCTSGKYSQGGSNVPCLPCGANTVSPPGSTRFDQCQCNAALGYYENSGSL